MSYTSTTGIFVRSTTDPVISMPRMWLLENINYRKGDVTLDGNITQNDATEIQKYLGDQVDFTNIKLYLTDINNDRVINVKDATYIQTMLTDEE